MLCEYYNPVANQNGKLIPISSSTGKDPFAFASSTCYENIGVASGTVVHTFTSGELVADFFLFAIFTVLCIELFFKINRRIKIWYQKR